MNATMRLVECPRDAMQGWPHQIPTEKKIEYLNLLLKAGFETLDFGAFVSPKAIPQMADTKEVLAGLKLDETDTKLLAIIADLRGANDAVAYDEIRYLGFPFSISETFQIRNTNKTIAESLVEVAEIQHLCKAKGKELVVYISMGFGNPYGDEFSPQLCIHWVKELANIGVKTIALSDTVGVAHPETIRLLFSTLIPAFPEVTIGAHFHSTPETWKEKIEAAWEAGCRRFDSSVKGIGGCPMAEDKLVGNIATENLLGWCREKQIDTGIDEQIMQEAIREAAGVFI